MIVYKITNSINGKVYIGQTTRSLLDRQKEHIRDLRGGKHHNQVLQATYNKHGMCFEFEALASGRYVLELDQLEIIFIETYQSCNKKYGYNLRGGGLNGTPTEETRAKISKSHTGKTKSPEHRRKMAEANRNRCLGSRNTDASRHKISNAAKIRWQIKRETGDMVGASLGMLWWNNGVTNTRSVLCPAEGWVSGQLSKPANCVWWNNGVSEVFRPECSDMGWVRGRIFRKRNKRSRKSTLPLDKPLTTT